MDQFNQAIDIASNFLWDNLLLFLLLGTGIFFTLRLGFVQVRRFGTGMKNLFSGFSLNGKAAGKDGMSSFQALTTAVAAQVGTGNITGCATALASGGPGAIFWMWVSAFFGMATIYAEAILAQTFRTTIDGQVTGGPIYYIRAAFKGRFGKFLAGFFSVAIVVALGFTGNMVQSNSISDAFHNAFGVSKLAVGIIVALIAAFIFLGGVKRLASVTEKIVPAMAVFYILGCVGILISRWQLLPNAFEQIFVLAFQPQAIAGGVAGVTVREAMRYGVARGLYSNEAGEGTAPVLHSAAQVDHPVRQGFYGIIEVFVDTFLICSATGIVVLLTGAAQFHDNAATLTAVAFDSVVPGMRYIMYFSLILFAGTSIMNQWYFGHVSLTFLKKESWDSLYRYAFPVLIVIGSLGTIQLVWSIQDIALGLLIIPNIVAMLFLSPEVRRLTKEFLDPANGYIAKRGE